MTFTTLVSADELARHVDDPAWIVFDCRHNLAKPEAGERAYLVSHIPGARFLHLDRDLSGACTGSNGRHPLPEPGVFVDRMRAAGMGKGMQAVAYDDMGGVLASRLWWMLRWLGHDAAAVLDGGLQAWRAAGHPETDALPAIRPGDFSGTPSGAWVDAGHVLSHLDGSGMCLVDARSAERFRGIGETLDPVGGRIPGSLNRPYTRNLQPDGRFKVAGELRGEFDELLRARPPGEVVHTCGSGVSACHNLLAMEVAGRPGSKLYVGSWSEWCSDPGRPFAAG